MLKTTETGLPSLIGKKVEIKFDMPSIEWPVKGSPARFEVVDFEYPMICLLPNYSEEPFWFNLSKIMEIRIEQ